MLIFVTTHLVRNKIFVLLATLLMQLCIYGQTEIKKISLNEAVEIGIRNNPEVKSAIENISASKGRFWSGISLPQPEVGVSFEYTPVNRSLSNYSEKTLSVIQSFEFPSNYFLKGSKYNKEEEVAIYKLKQIERSVINQVKTSYYKVLAKQYQVKSAEENLSISEDFFKKAEIKQNVGEGTNLERLTAKVQYNEARNNLEVAKNELRTALAELNYSLGFKDRSNNTNFELTDTLVFLDYKISIEQIYKSLEETNPHIKIAELEYGIASIEKGLAWTSLLPNFNLSYFKQTRDGNNGFYGASFGISVPLWFIFDQRGKIQEATANKSAAESELQLTKNDIALKMKIAFIDFENCLAQVKFYIDEIIPQAEEIHRSAIKSYDAGELTYLEYLQAKQTLINARNNYINSLFNYYQSIFRIEEIAGQNIIDNSELEK